MQNTNFLVAALTSAFISLPAAAARADFGSQGIVAIQGNPRLELVHGTTTDPDGDSTSSNGLGIGVAAQYFAADHVAVGVGLQAARESEDDLTVTTFAVQLVAGYQLHARERLHIWPQVLLAVARQSVDLSGDPSLTIVGTSIFVPAVYEIADHLLIGWGPIAGTTIYSSFERDGNAEESSKSNVIGAQAMFGGWF